MPRFQDATGYLIELRDVVNEAWFNAVCDMALESTGQQPTSMQLDDLWDYLNGLRTYIPAAAVARPLPSTPGATPPAVFLEELFGFSGFKKLSPGLHFGLTKQVTLVFGKNGSGKSSVCQALKVLAHPEKPKEPLYNARTRAPAAPSFSYRFGGAFSAGVWTEAVGFGAHAQSIKYFDSTVALVNATGNVRPEEAVEISVYRLEVFEYARAILNAFHSYAVQRMNSEITLLRNGMEALKTKLSQTVAIGVEPFSAWSPENSGPLASWIGSLPIFDSTMEAQLIPLSASLDQHLAALSDEGLRALRAQLALLEHFENSLTELNQMCIDAPLGILQAAESQYLQKQAAALELSKDAFPPGIDPSRHQAIIASASALTNLAAAAADSTVCPLCRQVLSKKAEELFRAYHAHLTSTIQAEINALGETLRVGVKNLSRVRLFVLSDFSACRENFPNGFFEALTLLIEIIRGSIPKEGAPPTTGNTTEFARSAELDHYINIVREARNRVAATIKTGTENRGTLDAEITKIRNQIGSLRAHKAVCENRAELLALCQKSQTYSFFTARVRNIDITTHLRNMTRKGKDAHTELVLGTFEQRLDEEYRALSGMTLNQMGVRLASRGNQQDIIVTPHVGDDLVHRVLSEGEQKVHALAVFMCEATVSPHQILIFDDPVTSFDYNYISNFCERLRDFIRSQPDTQIIVLTHNWDFFVNLQSTINRTQGLNAKLSVQVLEDCATVDAYIEEWDRLCQQIECIVHAINEPDADQKERLSGLMRRLIERLTNAYVFNEQRHQYKIKSLKVSDFQLFTKVVPLLPQEANNLRDLYANLSPPEHDDVRNYYATKSKAQFKMWYDSIVAVKCNVEGRRP